jgi:pimeloyl-ACP methyl ester carboxylesterase
MPHFDSDGVRLHYELAGDDDGQPILVVHGFCSDYRLNWVGTRWQETLTRSGRLVVGLDLRGHGQSDKPHDPGAYARSTMAADAMRVLDHLGIGRAEYLGYSMGARIGLEVAIHNPGRFSKFVLGGLGGLGAPTKADLIARRLRGDESVEDPAALMFYNFAAARPINDLEALACCILGPQPPTTPAELASISVPVAVMAGDRDPIARDAPEVARRIPGAIFVPIEGRDHMNAVPARRFKDAAMEFLGPA